MPNSRKAKLNEIWKSKEWKDSVKEFVSGRSCEWCGSNVYLTAHHPYYSAREVYLDLYLSGCMVLCRRCHFALHHSMTLCPVCKKKFCRNGTPMCYPCYLAANPGISDAIERKKQAMKDKKKASDKAYREKLKLQGKLHNKNNKRPD